jgi:glutaminyl-peptide cyclotransferase
MLTASVAALRSLVAAVYDRRGLSASLENSPTVTDRRYRPEPILVGLASLLLMTSCHPDNLPPGTKLWQEFSGGRAFAQVARLVGFGPRPSGSPALEQTRKYIIEQLTADGWQVDRQTFTNDTPHGPIQFVNLIARYKDAKASDARAIVCTHYDTKFFEPQIFVGANDGGSGTGALIELARVLGEQPGFARRFELVFFDGEEAIREFRVDSPPLDGLYGSRYYARSLRESGRAGQFKLGILWDMMGDKDLDVTLPPTSPPKLMQGIFDASEALGTREYFGIFRGDILDDHVPLNKAGIPTIDIIDFDFAAWHTPGDTLDKVSAESLQIVGQATLYHLCQVAPELK